MSNYVELSHVSKTFTTKRGTNEVVKDVNFSVKENELVVIFGPGQCGKTTLLNLIAGLESITEGKIEVAGNVVEKAGPDRGVVYQKTALFPWMTVMGNVSYGPVSCGKSKKEAQEIAQHYIDLVGLNGFEKSFPNQLSGGMAQRVGIARAYANRPALLLMDEPFGHLDAQTRYLMQEELIRVWEQEKRTIVFVTNNIEEAIYLADRIIVLSSRPGRIKNIFESNLPEPRDRNSLDFLNLKKVIYEQFFIEEFAHEEYNI